MQERHTVPLPDDGPSKVAAPEQKPQSAPVTAGAADSGAAAPPGESWKQTAKISGVKVDFRGVASLRDVVLKQGPLAVSLNDVISSEMVEGQQAILQFRITDAAGAPMSGLKMAAWMDQIAGQPADAAVCHKKIQSFLQMQLSARPEVDLNTYYVLALTTEPAILVIDPRIGFSTSKLYAVIDLPAPGADWVQSRNGERVFVSLPSTNQIAAIDSMTFRFIGNINLPGRPDRVAVQQDGKYLWITMDSLEGAEGGGVVVMETSTLKIAARVGTGKGRHELAFDGNQNAYVTNVDDGAVSVISGSSLTKVKDIAVGKEPVSIAYSERSKSVYVTGKAESRITVISTENLAVTGTIADRPGLGALILTLDGRWGFAANTQGNEVVLFDVASNKVVQKYKVGHSPDQLALSTSYLYVRSRQSEQVRLIPLGELGMSASTAEFPAGQSAPGAMSELPATPIVPSLDGDSAFIANPADRRIYYYQEGMAAPMFSMEGYGKTPTAVMVIDRSIHETERGIYSVGLRLPKPGVYDVPLFVESPSISHCFEFTVLENPLLKKKPSSAVNLQALNNYMQVKTGDPSRVRFRLTDAETNQPKNGLADVQVTVLLAEGLRQLRLVAEPVGDGVYQFEFTPATDGVYYGMVQVPSLKTRANELPYLMIRSLAKEAAQEKPPETTAAEQPRKP
jgi:YVTN family beta-propeller protein